MNTEPLGHLIFPRSLLLSLRFVTRNGATTQTELALSGRLSRSDASLRTAQRLLWTDDSQLIAGPLTWTDDSKRIAERVTWTEGKASGPGSQIALV
jgi:hypothetical protein